MTEQVKDMKNDMLMATYRTLTRLRETNFRLYGESDPWIDARVDEIADEIGNRGLDLDNR